MSLIELYIKANLTDEDGRVIGTVNGIVLDKVSGVKKVEAQRLMVEGRRKICTEYIPVDYYLLRTKDNKFVKVEATQVIGYGDNENSIEPQIHVL